MFSWRTESALFAAASSAGLDQLQIKSKGITPGRVGVCKNKLYCWSARKRIIVEIKILVLKIAFLRLIGHFGCNPTSTHWKVSHVKFRKDLLLSNEEYNPIKQTLSSSYCRQLVTLGWDDHSYPKQNKQIHLVQWYWVEYCTLAAYLHSVHTWKMASMCRSLLDQAVNF